jgi:hypothetical protein
MPVRPWTPAQRRKQSQLIQNWKPWKTAGVKTAEGKAISSMNAYKGGMRIHLRELSRLLREQREQLKRFTE